MLLQAHSAQRHADRVQLPHRVRTDTLVRIDSLCALLGCGAPQGEEEGASPGWMGGQPASRWGPHDNVLHLRPDKAKLSVHDLTHLLQQTRHSLDR